MPFRCQHSSGVSASTRFSTDCNNRQQGQQQVGSSLTFKRTLQHPPLLRQPAPVCSSCFCQPYSSLPATPITLIPASTPVPAHLHRTAFGARQHRQPGGSVGWCQRVGACGGRLALGAAARWGSEGKGRVRALKGRVRALCGGTTKATGSQRTARSSHYLRPAETCSALHQLGTVTT